jgi:uncharacterized protein (DUF302 family)
MVALPWLHVVAEDGGVRMDSSKLGYTKTLSGVTDLATAQEKATEALKQNGFGIITEIDVEGTVKAKLDIEIRPYKILGACNPKLAHQALAFDPYVGLLLPCNVIVFENPMGEYVVSFAKPTELFTLVDRPEMAGIAEQVDGMIAAAFEAL